MAGRALDEPLYQARVRSAIAPMHAEPKAASLMVSQQLAGHVVDVVAEEGEWLRARGVDRYEGWVHRGYVARDPAATMRASGRAVRLSLGCTTRGADEGSRALPLRA